MKIKTDLRLIIEKLLKIKEVVWIFFSSEGSGFSEKNIEIGEKIWKDTKTGKIQKKKVVFTFETGIVIKQKSANEAVKAKIAKIVGDIPYEIV